MDDREQRFEALYVKYYGPLMRYAARRVDDNQPAECVAETFTIAWKRLDDLRDGDPLPWLYGIARRVLANDRRARFRRRRLAERLIAETPYSSDDHAEGVAQRVDLAEALEALSPRDLECLRLAEWERLSAADAATVMGCSTVAYKVRLHRARRRLAATYAGEAAPTRTTGNPTTQLG